MCCLQVIWGNQPANTMHAYKIDTQVYYLNRGENWAGRRGVMDNAVVSYSSWRQMTRVYKLTEHIDSSYSVPVIV